MALLELISSAILSISMIFVRKNYICLSSSTEVTEPVDSSLPSLSLSYKEQTAGNYKL